MEYRLNKNANQELSTLTMISDESGFEVASVIVFGKEECALLDCQWTKSQAELVLAEIHQRNLDLKTIFVSHAHPDHYLAAAVFKNAYPNAKLVAPSDACRIINKQFTDKADYWEEVIGKHNVPREEIKLVPNDTGFEVEGQKVEIIPEVMGDWKYNSLVWIPSIKTVYGTDILFSQAHPFTCELTPDELEAWYVDLDKILALGADTIIPGHAKPGMPFDERSVYFTKDYIRATQEVLKTKHTVADFYFEMIQRFPAANLLISNDMNANVYKGTREFDFRDDGIDPKAIAKELDK